MIPDGKALEEAKAWAMQTYVFAMNVRNPRAPTEVMEKITIDAIRLGDWILSEVETECGDKATAAARTTVLINKVLDWVVKYKQME
jgi:hypothetical protein